MKRLALTRQWFVALLLLTLVSSCGKKETEEILPLDESSGAPLVPLTCGAYRTFTQSEWDQPASDGPSPGTYRDLNFATVFLNGGTNGLVIGIVGETGREYLRFTSAAAIQGFLPQTGEPAPLTLGAENPPAGTQYNAFAGEVAVLKMNLYYDDYEHRRTPLRTGAPLRFLTIADGPLKDLNPERVLHLAERTLGGDPVRTATFRLADGSSRTYTFTLRQLYEATKAINENFAGGTVNRGYLRCI